MKRSRARTALLGLSLLVALGAKGPCGTTTPQPFDEELLVNGGFETGTFTPWVVDAGSCEVDSAPLGIVPTSGSYLFYGGDDPPVASCLAHQEIDLAAHDFRPYTIDQGRVAVEGQVWLRNWMNAGNFDDQVSYEISFLDENRNEISSLHTLIGGDNEWLLRQASGRVPPGTRHLRVSLDAKFRRALKNLSFADDASLVLVREESDPLPIVTLEPMLQDYRQDAMTLLWETEGNLSPFVVEYGVAGGPLDQVATRISTTQTDATHFVHVATLTGLSAETEYDYRLRSGDAILTSYRFRTAPLETTPFRIAVVADNQNGPAVFTGLVQRMAARDPDLFLAPGDVVQNGDVFSEWTDQWWTPLSEANFAQTTPVLFARGNHDGEHALAYAYSALPENGAWYGFRYGNTYFAVLDTEANAGASSPENNQEAWLQAAFTSPEALSAEFRIAVFHRLPYTNFWTPSGICSYSGQPWVRDQWVPLLEALNVDLVISGHSHSYQRGQLNGVRYLVVGGGGGALDQAYGCDGVPHWEHMNIGMAVHHYNMLAVDGNVLSWTAYDENDQVIDQFDIAH